MSIFNFEEPTVYPQCKPKIGQAKLKCLIKQIEKDNIPQNLKCLRVNYLIAINKKTKWTPQKPARTLIEKSKRRLKC